MVYLLAFVVLLLAGAVVVLFAMLGELYSRVGPAAATDARPLPGAKVGHRPDIWPAEFDRLGAAEDAVLLVLSTSCTTCALVAGQLRDHPDPLSGRDLGVVVSTPDRERGEAFVRQHGLAGDSVFVDAGGTWAIEAFGVQSSPSALVLRRGRLSSALVFNDIAALRAAMVPTEEAV